MKKRWTALAVVMVMVFQLLGGWSVAEDILPPETGVIIHVDNTSGSAIEGVSAMVTHRVALTETNERDGDYVPYSLDGGPYSSDSNGRIELSLEQSYVYIIKLSKANYWDSNIEVVHQQEASYMDLILYDSTESTGELFEIPDTYLNIQQVGDGTGLNIGIAGLNINYPEYAHYSVLLKPSDYSISNDGLPYDMMYDIYPTNQSVERRVSAGNYRLLIFYFDDVIVGDQTEYNLKGYTTKDVVVEEAAGPGPGPGPDQGTGPSLSGELTFLIKNTVSETVKTIIKPYESMQREMYVAVQALDSGSIAFPLEFLGKENPGDVNEVPVAKAVRSISFVGHTQPLDEPPVIEMDVNPYWFISSYVNINNFGGSITGDAETGFNLNFTSAFERIAIEVEIDDSEILTVVFYQPGFDTMKFHFEMTGADPDVIETVGLTQGEQWINVQVPVGLSEGRVRTTVTYADGKPLPDLLGGVWEYLADRSEIVDTWNEEVEGVFGINLDYQRYFGKVTIHYRFMVGNSEASAMVTYYESDFSGLDVWGPFGTGEWHSGITNISQPDNFLPTGFIYFLNQEVYLRPLEIGRGFDIVDINIKEDGVFVPVVHEYLDQEHIQAWRVELPDVATDPVTNLQLTIRFDDDLVTEVEIPLQIRRVLVGSTSRTYNEEDKAHFLAGNEDLWFEYTGEDEITFVTAFSYEPQGPHVPEDEPQFPLDHKLLVIYYYFDQVLGSKQFSIVSNGNERNELIVLRKGGTMDGEYANVSNANRITMFLIDRDGISSQNNTFGGASFGIGAGFGHLLPNHPNFGTGKDGMDYDY